MLVCFSSLLIVRPNVSATVQTLQPHDSAGIRELALDPTLFGSSTALLNVIHHEVYFSRIPEWNGKVCMSVLGSLLILQG